MTTAFDPRPNTLYVLRFAHSGLALSAEHLSRDNRVRLVQRPYARGGDQEWSFRDCGEGWYAIRPRFGGKSVKVKQSDESDRAVVHLWDSAGSSVPENEQWRLIPHERGGYELVARHSGKCLDLQAASPLSGAYVQQFSRNRRDNQRVTLTAVPMVDALAPDPELYYRLRMANSGRVLQAHASEDRDGVEISLQDPRSGLAQQWRFEATGGGWYFIRPRHSERVLDVAGASQSAGAKVQLWTKSGGHHQQWKIEADGSAYWLRSRRSGKILTIEGSSLDVDARALQADRGARVRIEPVAAVLPEPVRHDVARLDGERPVRLPPIRSFNRAREATIEGWIRPTRASSSGHETLIELGARGSRFALERDDRRLLVRVYRGDDTHTLITSAELLRARAWAHVGVTVRHDNGDNRYDLELYVDGERVATGRTGRDSSRDGRKVFASSVQDQTAIGSAYDGSARFVGDMAELCFWSKRRSSAEFERSFDKRRRGTETDLAGCYHLDRVVGQRLIDASVHRLDVEAASAAIVDGGEALPLSPSGPSAGGIASTSMLARETFSKSMLGADALATLSALAAVDESEDAPSLGLADVGAVSGDYVELSVFDVELRPHGIHGEALADEAVELYLRRDQVAILDNLDGSSRAELWSAGQRILQTDGEGRLALRFVAVTTDSPGLYARVAQMPREVWAPIRSDTSTYAELHRVRGAELRAPSDGRRSPLPQGTTLAEAEAFADLCAGLAWIVTPPPEDAQATSSTRSIGGAIRKRANWFAKLGDALEDEGPIEWKPSERLDQLIGSASELIAAATDEVPRVGKRALIRSVAQADELSIDVEQLGGARPLVHIVGRTASQAWRVLVSTAEEVGAAIGSLLRRIGADFIDFVEYLAGLFDWRRFLQLSDDFHDEVLASLSGVQAELANEGPIRAKIDELLDPAPDSPTFDRSMNDWLAELGEPKPPKQLRQVLRYTKRIFRSPKLKVPMPSLDVDLSLPGLDSVEQAIEDAIPAMVFDGTLTSAPLRPVLETPVAVWGSLADTIDALYSSILGLADDAIEGVEDLLNARLKIPLITGVMEDVILSADGRARPLTLLRLVSLIAAIPTALSDAVSSLSSGDTGGSPVYATASDEGDAGDDDERYTETQRRNARRAYHKLSQAQAGLGIGNWCLLVARAWASDEDLQTALTALQGCLLITIAGVDFSRASAAGIHKPASRTPIRVSAILNVTDGLCCLATVGVKLDESEGAKEVTEFGLEVAGNYVLGVVWIIHAAVFGNDSGVASETAYRVVGWSAQGVGRWCRKGRKSKAKRRVGSTLGVLGVTLESVYLGKAIYEVS